MPQYGFLKIHPIMLLILIVLVKISTRDKRNSTDIGTTTNSKHRNSSMLDVPEIIDFEFKIRNITSELSLQL